MLVNDMYNALISGLPDSYEGYPVNTDFETGIQIMQALDDDELTDEEKWSVSESLLFDGLCIPDPDTAVRALLWWLTGWNNDNKDSGGDNTVVMDMCVDQWRIYSAFRSQYHIDLIREDLHFWEFMALLTTLNDCAFTRIVDIRCAKERSGMSLEEKRSLREAKRRYSLKRKRKYNSVLPPAEQEFLKYVNIGKANTAP